MNQNLSSEVRIQLSLEKNFGHGGQVVKVTDGGPKGHRF